MLGSNAAWLWHAVDAAALAQDQDAVVRDQRLALKQALALVSVLARGERSRLSTVAAASAAAGNEPGFEKDGRTWVGRLGLRFGANDELVDAELSW
jgi:hypothetical protein